MSQFTTSATLPQDRQRKLDEILSRLHGVRRAGAGYIALCPSHDDRNPSLNICEADRGLLLFCHAGCDLADICAALGIKPRDLFYDAGDMHESEAWRTRQRERTAALAKRQARRRQADLRREAERVIRAATHITIEGWSDATLDRVVEVVMDARAVLLQEHAEGDRHEN